MIDSSPHSAPVDFDIFCRVIDNFGDIGVCWRLARQLASMAPVCRVRLWVDDLYSFAKIESGVDPRQSRQTIHGIELVHWTNSPPDLQPCQVVVEAFACTPPPAFIARMNAGNSLWINLEYLSAEDWVESCHALPSLQASGLRKAFFFPGFTAGTGGLLREAQLLDTRDRWLSQPVSRKDLLRSLHVPDSLIEGLLHGWRQVYLFCYPNAPVAGLLESLGRDDNTSVILVPAGVCPSLKNQRNPRVHVVEIPFVGQTDFDRLLWSSDLNFVRGEDSLVRAIWAGRPFIWQIYEQQEAIHLVKLQAWLARTPFQAGIHGLMNAWNTAREREFGVRLDEALSPSEWPQWQAQARLWAEEMARNNDLGSSLLAFCMKTLQTG